MKPIRRVIGVTGGIASGKSTVLEMLGKRGLPILSADLLARGCVEPGTAAYRAILNRFGRSFATADGPLDRKKLGQLVFTRPVERRKLERIIHPCVIRGLKRFIRQHKELVAVDIPLLFEAKLEGLVDDVLVVYTTQAKQLARLGARNGLGRVEALQRIRAQQPLREKCRRAQYVIKNVGSKRDLESQVNVYVKSYLSAL